MRCPGGDAFWLQGPRLPITRLTPLLAPAPGRTGVVSQLGIERTRPAPLLRARARPYTRNECRTIPLRVLICRQSPDPTGAEADREPGVCEELGGAGFISASFEDESSVKM